MIKEKEYECSDCGAYFDVIHEESFEPVYCVFCGEMSLSKYDDDDDDQYDLFEEIEE